MKIVLCTKLRTKLKSQIMKPLFMAVLRGIARNRASDGQKVTVRQDGRDREIVLNADDESILDAALRQGADLPYACKGGVCATCKCKVLRGKVAMETNYSLEPDELAAGYVLSCQALPLTSDVVVDFDAKGMA